MWAWLFVIVYCRQFVSCNTLRQPPCGQPIRVSCVWRAGPFLYTPYSAEPNFFFVFSLCSGLFKSFWHVYKGIWGHINKYTFPPQKVSRCRGTYLVLSFVVILIGNCFTIDPMLAFLFIELIVITCFNIIILKVNFPWFCGALSICLSCLMGQTALLMHMIVTRLAWFIVCDWAK